MFRACLRHESPCKHVQELSLLATFIASEMYSLCFVDGRKRTSIYVTIALDGRSTYQPSDTMIDHCDTVLHLRRLLGARSFGISTHSSAYVCKNKSSTSTQPGLITVLCVRASSIESVVQDFAWRLCTVDHHLYQSNYTMSLHRFLLGFESLGIGPLEN